MFFHNIRLLKARLAGLCREVKPYRGGTSTIELDSQDTSAAKLDMYLAKGLLMCIALLLYFSSNGPCYGTFLKYLFIVIISFMIFRKRIFNRK